MDMKEDKKMMKKEMNAYAKKDKVEDKKMMNSSMKKKGK